MLIYATNEPNYNKRKIGEALPIQKAYCMHPTICDMCNYFYIDYRGNHKC